jgi:hypothetical protein
LNGNEGKAKEVLQINIFKHVTALFKTLAVYLMYCGDDIAKLEEIYRMAIAAADTFRIREIHPHGLIGLYLSVAQGFITNGHTDKALDSLQKYVELVTSDIYPLEYKCNDFFDLVDDWINMPELTVEVPLDDKAMKQGLADAVIKNPTFASLCENGQFRNIVERLKNNIGE